MTTKKPSDHVILRELSPPYTVVVTYRSKMKRKPGVRISGHQAAGMDEFLKGTPEQIDQYIKETYGS